MKIGQLIENMRNICLQMFNANLGGLFRDSFRGRGDDLPRPPPSHTPTTYLKFVRIILETWNLVRKYTHICSFRKYTF